MIASLLLFKIIRNQIKILCKHQSHFFKLLLFIHLIQHLQLTSAFNHALLGASRNIHLYQIICEIIMMASHHKCVTRVKNEATLNCFLIMIMKYNTIAALSLTVSAIKLPHRDHTKYNEIIHFMWLWICNVLSSVPSCKRWKWREKEKCMEVLGWADGTSQITANVGKLSHIRVIILVVWSLGNCCHGRYRHLYRISVK